MTNDVVRTDRSRSVQYQRCARSRWLEYHEAGIGIVAIKKPLPLAVGGAVHVGLAALLRKSEAVIASHKGADGVSWISDDRWRRNEDEAVELALLDFEEFANGRLEIDLYETNQMDLSAFDEPQQVEVRSKIDQYVYEEQRALVEAMVRAYARRRLRPLLDEFEVLEVEREGDWCLSWGGGQRPDVTPDLWFMSRPDALLRQRATNDLYIQSYKSGAKWDVRKGRDAEHDAQGLSEGVEIEKRLADWWEVVHHNQNVIAPHTSRAMLEYLMDLPAPPRIMGIRYEFLWKGDRRKDKDLTARFGVALHTQSSHLVRGYLNQGMAAGDEQWNWSWEYLKEGGETSKLYWKTWRGAPVWEHMPIAKWIDLLDATVETVAEEGRAAGWSGPAQRTGFTTGHPLDECFHPPITVYRNDDDLRDWLEQTEAQEVRVAIDVATVEAAGDEGEKRSLLNLKFPQARHACEYPSTCQFVRVCYGGEDIRRDPLASGLYRLRVPNHPQEVGK